MTDTHDRAEVAREEWQKWSERLNPQYTANYGKLRGYARRYIAALTADRDALYEEVRMYGAANGELKDALDAAEQAREQAEAKLTSIVQTHWYRLPVIALDVETGEQGVHWIDGMSAAEVLAIIRDDVPAPVYESVSKEVSKGWEQAEAAPSSGRKKATCPPTSALTSGTSRSGRRSAASASPPRPRSRAGGSLQTSSESVAAPDAAARNRDTTTRMSASQRMTSRPRRRSDD
jgi:hypothetical protein